MILIWTHWQTILSCHCQKYHHHCHLFYVYFTTQLLLLSPLLCETLLSAVLRPFYYTKIILLPNTAYQFLHLHLESLCHSIAGIILFASSFVAVVVWRCRVISPYRQLVSYLVYSYAAMKAQCVEWFLLLKKYSKVIGSRILWASSSLWNHSWQVILVDADEACVLQPGSTGI